MLRMAPGRPAAIRRAANSCEQTNVPFSTMSTTDRHPFGLSSAAATGKLPAAVFTRTPTAPSEASTVSNAAVTDSGCRTSIATAAARPPTASMAATPRARCASSRLAMATAAPSRANSTAMALPRPVPPPVTRTTSPSNVLGGSIVVPSGGGSGSAMGPCRTPRLDRQRPCSPCVGLPTQQSMATDATDTVLLEIDGSIATVTLNRPDRLNAWSWEMGMALAERMEAIAENRDVRAVVLRGAGRSFCAGIDLKREVRDRIVGRSPAEKVLNYYHRYRGSHRRTQGIEAIPQPIVVAIHGHCLGAGFEIAMLGDIRLAAEGTVFGCPEVKIGVAIDCGLDLRLAQEVGASWAKWLTLTGRRIDADRAFQLGIVQEVYPEDQVVAAATGLAREIAANAPLAVQAVKRTVDRHANRGLDEALDFEALNAAVGFVSDDLVEGFTSGREKRPARFEGK